MVGVVVIVRHISGTFRAEDILIVGVSGRGCLRISAPKDFQIEVEYKEMVVGLQRTGLGNPG